MFRTRTSVMCSFAAALLAALMLSGCAKKPIWGNPETGLILTYRMEPDESLTYRTTNDFIGTMEVMGQSMEITGDEWERFTVTAKAARADNPTITITVDSLYIDVTTPQGGVKADVTGAIGKSFDMVLSPLGRELELIGADAIEYEMPPQGKRSIESSFRAIFPDLLAGPVKVGDSWTATDSITEKSGESESFVVLNNTHTLAGLETRDGMRCARITTAVTGTVHGKGKQAGMEFISESTIEAHDTWYFAYEKGCLVGSSSKGSEKGTIKDAGGGVMNIPTTREFTTTSTLVEKK